MVSFTLDAVKFLLIYRYLQNTYWFKRGNCTCCSSHTLKALALPCSSKRATPKAPRQCKYTIRPLGNKRPNRLKPIRLYRIHLMRRSRCFVFDNQLEVAKFLRRQNQSVQLRPFMYTCPPNLCPSDFRHGFRRYKVSTIASKTALFDSPKTSQSPDLILLNTNVSRFSTFS